MPCFVSRAACCILHAACAVCAAALCAADADAPIAADAAIAAAATLVDWDEVFSYYDIDRSGELDLPEFRKAIRKDAEIRVHQVSVCC